MIFVKHFIQAIYFLKTKPEYRSHLQALHYQNHSISFKTFKLQDTSTKNIGNFFKRKARPKAYGCSQHGISYRMSRQDEGDSFLRIKTRCEGQLQKMKTALTPKLKPRAPLNFFYRYILPITAFSGQQPDVHTGKKCE